MYVCMYVCIRFFIVICHDYVDFSAGFLAINFDFDAI